MLTGTSARMRGTRRRTWRRQISWVGTSGAARCSSGSRRWLGSRGGTRWTWPRTTKRCGSGARPTETTTSPSSPSDAAVSWQEGLKTGISVWKTWNLFVESLKGGGGLPHNREFCMEVREILMKREKFEGLPPAPIFASDEPGSVAQSLPCPFRAAIKAPSSPRNTSC